MSFESYAAVVDNIKDDLISRGKLKQPHSSWLLNFRVFVKQEHLRLF